jgi:hypothetical protein
MPSDLGAGERDRTADLPFTRRLLCQLSYTGGTSSMVAEPGPDLRICPLTCGDNCNSIARCGSPAAARPPGGTSDCRLGHGCSVT